MFLDALSERGLPGLLVLAGLCGVGFWCARRPGLPAVLGASLVAAMVSQQFTVFIVPTALYFYLTVAALVALTVPAGLAPREGGRRLRTAVPVLLAGCLLWYAARLAVSDLYLAVTKRLLDGGGIREAAATYERARRWHLPGASADLWYSRAMAAAASNSGDLLTRLEAAQRAMDAARRAAAHSENRANALYNLAIFHAAANDFEGTVAALRAAIQAAPQWFKPHWTLAQTLALAGRWDEAEAEAARAAELNGGRNPEVAETLDNIRLRRQPGPAGAGSHD
jgi:tetratricopeptide (TPR) repeat protein